MSEQEELIGKLLRNEVDDSEVEVNWDENQMMDFMQIQISALRKLVRNPDQSFYDDQNVMGMYKNLRYTIVVWLPGMDYDGKKWKTVLQQKYCLTLRLRNDSQLLSDRAALQAALIRTADEELDGIMQKVRIDMCRAVQVAAYKEECEKSERNGK